MKKVNTSLKAQARRHRALERFSIDPNKLQTDDGHGYAARKAVELAALKSRCGV